MVMVIMQSAPDTLFKTLADPTRRAIFERLSRDGEQTVQCMTDRIGRLAARGIQASGRTEAAPVWCAIAAQGARPITAPSRKALVPLIDWMSFYGAFWRDRFDRLEDLLKRMDQ